METLWLCLDRRPVRAFKLTTRWLEVGRSESCDVVVHEPEIPDRAYLIRPDRGSVVAYDLGAGPVPGRRIVLGIGASLPLGGGYSLLRRRDARSGAEVRSTDRLAEGEHVRRSLSLVIGQGPSARRVLLKDAPLSVGSAADNSIVISDRAVSRFHCRFEPFDGGVVLRDLQSCNGTWVGGHRVQRVELQAGATMRIGRTDLHLVVRGGEIGHDGGELVAESPAMLSVLAEVDRYARLPWPVLIQGESGVGKEHVAHALHLRSARSERPFVALNAGGLPAHLVESELFGHERGAFTGAVAAHKGVFEQAEGGTLFLDEIAELPLELQSRLLRVLETWSMRPVGGEQERPVNVRLVCATHQDLRKKASQGTFRADLYYRINRLLIEVPPLRKRTEDIQPLVAHFLHGIESEVGVRLLSHEAFARLLRYPWPGNARELRNVISTAAATGAGPTLTANDIDKALGRIANADTRLATSGAIADVVAQYQGNVSAAARALGVPRSTLRDRIKSSNGEA